MSEFNNNLTVDIDEKKLRRMLNKIYQLERKNSKTSKLNDKEMKAEIERIIEVS